MNIELKKNNMSSSINLSCDIDISNADSFKEAALEALKDEKGDIVFDFSKVGFVDSTGLGAFVAINNFVKKNDGKVIIKNANSLVKKVFIITKLNDVFMIED